MMLAGSGDSEQLGKAKPGQRASLRCLGRMRQLGHPPLRLDLAFGCEGRRMRQVPMDGKDWGEGGLRCCSRLKNISSTTAADPTRHKLWAARGVVSIALGACCLGYFEQR